MTVPLPGHLSANTTRCANKDMNYAELRVRLATWAAPLNGQVAVWHEVASTSDYLREHWPQQAISGAAWSVCVAQAQTAGRGRHGHIWQSDPGAGLWFSLAVPVAAPSAANAPPPLSLVLAAELIQALRSTHFPVNLKWPNDLWLHGKKVGGLLIEQLGRADARYWLVGVGINWHAPVGLMGDKTGVIPAVTGLLDESLRPNISREDLSIALIHRTMAIVQSPDEWQESMRHINQFNVLSGRRIQVWESDRPLFQGVATDILPSGELTLITDEGRTHQIGGAFSVRVLT